MAKEKAAKGTCGACIRYTCAARKAGIACINYVDKDIKPTCAGCGKEIKPGEDYAMVAGKIVHTRCMNGAGKQTAARPKAQAQPAQPAQAQQAPPASSTALAIIPSDDDEECLPAPVAGKRAKA